MVSDTSVSLRFISQEDAIECGVTDMDRCVETIERVFKLHGKGHTLMGGPGSLTHGQIIPFPKTSADPKMPTEGPDRRFAAMPAYVGGEIYKIGVKWYSSNVANPEKGLPRSIHTIQLNDPDSGRPVSIIDGTLVSAMRTGAVAGVGARHARPDAEHAAVIGAGVIGRTVTMALDSALSNLTEVEFIDIDREKAELLADELASETTATVSVAESKDEALSAANVVVVAASGSTPPTIDPDCVDDETLVIPLGDVDMPLEVFSNIYMDDRNNIREFTEYIDWEVAGQLAQIVEHERSFDEFTPLSSLIVEGADKSVRGPAILFALGLPIEDVAWANAIYERAEEREIGHELTLFNEPLWT